MPATVRLLQFDDDTIQQDEGYATLISRGEDFGNPELYKKLFGIIVRYKSDVSSASIPFFYSTDGGENWTRFSSINDSVSSYAFLPSADTWEDVDIRPETRPVGTTFSIKFYDVDKLDFELQSLSYIIKLMNKAIG